MNEFAAIAATPYPWPLVGKWSQQDTAVVVIDMQRDFLLPGGYFAAMGENLEHVRRTIPPVTQLLGWAREQALMIVHTRESHRADLLDLNDTKRRKGQRVGACVGDPGPLGRLLVRGEKGNEIIDELQPRDGELVVDKPGNSAFYATDLEHILRARHIHHLVLAGITTDVCVSSTMRDANDRGFDCLLLEDCCGAAEPWLHEATMGSLRREGGIFGAYCASDELRNARPAE